MSRHATRQPRERSGFALRLHLALADTTTEAFARRINKPLRTVQRWRSGDTEPGAEDFALVMRELGLGHDYFYPDEEAAA